MFRPRLTIGTVVAAASLIAAGSANAATVVTQTASLGPVTATATYMSDPTGPVAPYSGLHLTIARAGTTLYSAAVNTLLCGTSCWPDDPDRAFVHVVDLNGDGQTEVVLDAYSGGAHCCSVDVVYSIDPTTGDVSQAQHVWGDPDAVLQDLSHDGRLEFVSADDRFAYKFDAFAFSGLPIQIERFSSGTFVDVTSSYPALVTADATRWYKIYRENFAGHTGLGALAAWAADEERLGHASLVTRVLARENRHGHLISDGSPWRGGSAFIKELLGFLTRTGYR